MIYDLMCCEEDIILDIFEGIIGCCCCYWWFAIREEKPPERIQKRIKYDSGEQCSGEENVRVVNNRFMNDSIVIDNKSQIKYILPVELLDLHNQRMIRDESPPRLTSENLNKLNELSQKHASDNFGPSSEVKTTESVTRHNEVMSSNNTSYVSQKIGHPRLLINETFPFEVQTTPHRNGLLRPMSLGKVSKEASQLKLKAISPTMRGDRFVNGQKIETPRQLKFKKAIATIRSEKFSSEHCNETPRQILSKQSGKFIIDG
jgi:hypothetical protein